jgi:cytochrome c-type biogenesis protein CcmE
VLVAALGLAMLNVAVPCAAHYLEASPVYTYDVRTVVENVGLIERRKIRVEGIYDPGSCTWQNSPCEYRFRLHQGEQSLGVRYPVCMPLPEVEVEGDIKVIVEGYLAPDGSYIEASVVMMRRCGKYHVPPLPRILFCGGS